MRWWRHSKGNEADLRRDVSRNFDVYTIACKCVASCAFRRLFFKSAPQATCPPNWEKCHRNSGIRTKNDSKVRGLVTFWICRIVVSSSHVSWQTSADSFSPSPWIVPFPYCSGEGWYDWYACLLSCSVAIGTVHQSYSNARWSQAIYRENVVYLQYRFKAL